ncbi:MAG: histidine kinase [Dehalococcoides mccartyi]|uniref:sensor histidine kinase n=1 Tax=Dehalococcoides mccartyi TaxID=61435 RepID=UPI000804BB17|nr:two-component regulator propeller domain-containing protein [Dehalococcoides mccartyi]OBW62535.1 MAG: histidine kinase [Dehalococcoides mccartyi]
MNRILLCIAIICLIVIPINPKHLNAQQFARFEHFSIGEGLSQSSVAAIIQDKEGFIWFGTRDGLNRFDGYTLQTFKNDLEDPKSIASSYINCLFEDSQGIIWVGTLSGGLNKFDKMTGTFSSFRHSAENTSTIASDDVRVIEEDPSGYLWLATPNGLDRFNPESDVFEHFNTDNGLSSNSIWSILIDKNGILWAGSEGGIDLFQPNDNVYQHYKQMTNASNGLSGSLIRYLFEDNQGNIWISTYNGVDCLNTLSNKLSHFENIPDNPNSLGNNRIRAICQDLSGNIWFGTTDGLDKLEPGSDNFTHFKYDPGNPDSLSNNIIWSLMVDSTGVLWIGTLNGGVNRFSLAKQVFICYRNNPGNPNSLSNNVVKSIYQDQKGILWIGTLGGLNKFDPINDIFESFHYDSRYKNSIASDTVKVITGDTYGNIWIGTTSGLDKYSEQSGLFTHFKHDSLNTQSISDDVVLSLWLENQTQLWVGTNAGLNRLDIESGEVLRFGSEYGLPETTIYTIFEYKPGILLLGTDYGLYVFDIKSKSTLSFRFDANDSNTISNNVVRCICLASNGNILIGTHNGLNTFDFGKGKFIRYSQISGVTYGILEDNFGYVWISGNNGLTRLSLANETIKTFNKTDGLQSDEFSEGAYYRDPSGLLYFGGINGLNVFDPSKLQAETAKPNIIITSLDLIGGSTSFKLPEQISGGITLEYENNSFTINFAALEFETYQKIKYYFQLVGFDKDLRIANYDQRDISYTNIDNGKYTFTIYAADQDESWVSDTAYLNIRITTPFWESWWFYSLCGVSSIATIYFIVKLRIWAIQKQKNRLESLVEVRTDQLKTEIEKQQITENKLKDEIENRAKFTRALVHELKTPLTSLSISSELFTGEATNEPFVSLSRSIERSVTNLSKRCDEMLDLARGETGLLKISKQMVDLDSFVEGIKTDLLSIAFSKGIHLTFEYAKNTRKAYIDPDRINEVINNLTDNALKFTPPNGTITIKTDISNEQFIFEISDTGCGINKEYQKRMFSPGYQGETNPRLDGLGIGLILAKMFIELHKGTIWVKSKPKSGSIFGFSIPIGEKD